MRLAEWDGRPPADVAAPPGWPGMVPVGPGDVDADGDGVPDTVVVPRARGGAWVFTDVDADGFADEVLDLDPDAAGDDDPGLLEALARWVTG